MPFCEPCNQFYNPNSLESATCPQCGQVLDTSHEHPTAAETSDGPVAPWHFWLMIGALSLYLGWRVVQGLISLFT